MSTTDPSGEALFRLAQQSQRHALRSRKRKLARCAGNAFGQSAKAQASGRAPQQKVGDHFEEVAWRLLKRAGCTLLARQLACPLGELDLVVREGVQLVFVEVRRRGSQRCGGAAASVSLSKQRRFTRAAQWWLPTLAQRYFGGQHPLCRLDVIAFEPDGVYWHRDAVRLAQDK